MFYGFKSIVFLSPGRPKTLYFTCPGLRNPQKMLISAPGAGDPEKDARTPGDTNAEPKLLPRTYVYILEWTRALNAREVSWRRVKWTRPSWIRKVLL